MLVKSEHGDPLTVAELRCVLDACDGNDEVHVCTDIDTGETRPMVMAMVSDDEPCIYVYVETAA